MRGARSGRPIDVSWDGGALTGDAAAIGVIGRMVAAGTTVGLEPVGPWMPAALGPAYVALLTVRSAFDVVAGVDDDGSDVLEVPGVDLPAGWVA